MSRVRVYVSGATLCCLYKYNLIKSHPSNDFRALNSKRETVENFNAIIENQIQVFISSLAAPIFHWLEK